MTTGPRNFGATPMLGREGYFTRPMNVPTSLPHTSDWHRGMSAFDRLNYHHTLASVRRFVYFKPVSGMIPGDALDVALGADFDQGTTKFPDHIDVLLQRATTGADTRRRARNILEEPTELDTIGAALKSASRSDGSFPDYDDAGHKSLMVKWKFDKNLYGRYNQHHALYVTGMRERRNTYNSKLMNSSHHSPQTNAGYSRQDSDGNAYQY